VTFSVEVFSVDEWADAAARLVAGSLPSRGVVIVTGGGSARKMYPRLAAHTGSWSDIEVFFSDERCVPPDHPDSNFNMARATLLDAVKPRVVHRMRGEDVPSDAAAVYDNELRVVRERPDLLLLGMGADGHIAGLFPRSPALDETARRCVAVNRPDGLQGLTMTRPALLSARKVMLIVTGAVKARAMRRALSDDESPAKCPVRMLADHAQATFLVDDDAVSP
jgi:6-phosphogluconolactonase